MKRFARLTLWFVTLLAAIIPAAARPFAAFDNGLNDVPGLEEKAALLKELGYEGIVWRPGRTAEMLTLLDRHGLKMIATYVVLQANEQKCPIPTNVIAEVSVLKGRDTLVWLCINGRSTDAVVVAGIRQIADLAATNGLRVAIYSHVGSYTDTEATALRLVRLADRANVGVSFNLCHFLRQNDEANLEPTLREIAPRLFLVSINGADGGDTRKMDWDRLIRPLGEGTFDVTRIQRALDAAGYQGPVGLQCFGLKAPARAHLSQSMKAWLRLSAVPGATTPAESRKQRAY